MASVATQHELLTAAWRENLLGLYGRRDRCASKGTVQHWCTKTDEEPIFFFNNPSNPLRFTYGTMAILVICTITHFYTVAHLTALTALKQMDAEFEAVSACLKQPFYKMLLQVTVPVCLPAIFDIAIYLFVNAMTTVSAVVFLYSPETTLAAVAVLNMDDAGNIAPAAAMGMMIFYTNIGARLLHGGFTYLLHHRMQAWRVR